MNKYVVGFLFGDYHNGTKAVALIEKQRGPNGMAGQWNGIGGRIEPQESAMECMRREFLEETGVAIEDWEVFCVLEHSESNRESFQVFFFYAVDDRIKDVQTTTDEKVRIFQTFALPKNMMNNLHWLIPMAAHMDHEPAAWLWIREMECPESYTGWE